MNRVFLLGNLTRDPELRYTPQGTAVCSLGLAVNRRYATGSGGAREETCFVDIDVWGRQAQTCSSYLRKGAPALVEGRLKLEQWDDRETGKRRSRLRVQADRVQFVGPPQGASFADADAGAGEAPGGDDGPGPHGPPQEGHEALPGRTPMPAFEPLPEASESAPDDIPF